MTSTDSRPAVTDKPASLAAALAAFQAELPKVPKTKTAVVQHKDGGGSHRYNYADLADFSTIVLPLLAKHGLSFSSLPTLDEGGRLVLEYTLRHSGGDSVTGRYPLGSGTSQQIGSAITYARRYALSAITGVAADEDDDGKAANDAPVQHPAEPYWDHDEQQMLTDGFLAELDKAVDDAEIQEIGGRVKAQRAKNQLSPTSYAKLAKAAAEKLAVLEQAKKAEPKQPELAEVKP